MDVDVLTYKVRSCVASKITKLDILNLNGYPTCQSSELQL